MKRKKPHPNERVLACGVCDEIAKAHDGAGLHRPVIYRVHLGRVLFFGALGALVLNLLAGAVQ